MGAGGFRSRVINIAHQSYLSCNTILMRVSPFPTRFDQQVTTLGRLCYSLTAFLQFSSICVYTRLSLFGIVGLAGSLQTGGHWFDFSTGLHRPFDLPLRIEVRARSRSSAG